MNSWVYILGVLVLAAFVFVLWINYRKEVIRGRREGYPAANWRAMLQRSWEAGKWPVGYGWLHDEVGPTNVAVGLIYGKDE